MYFYSGHCCGHCAGTVRAPCGHCAGTVSTPQTDQPAFRKQAKPRVSQPASAVAAGAYINPLGTYGLRYDGVCQGSRRIMLSWATQAWLHWRSRSVGRFCCCCVLWLLWRRPPGENPLAKTHPGEDPLAKSAPGEDLLADLLAKTHPGEDPLAKSPWRTPVSPIKFSQPLQV